MIILILGLPGTGKSYFAKALSNYLNVTHFNTDLVRNEIEKRGKYNDRNKKEVYSELLRRVQQHLETNRSVIVDATFSKKSNRVIFQNLADKLNIKIAFIEIVAEELCIKERIKIARIDSQADFKVYNKIKAEYEPIDTDRLILHSDKMTLDEMIVKAKTFLEN